MDTYKIRVEKPIIYSHELQKVQYKCKCGHTVTIPEFVDKQLCTYCGVYVFKSKKDEFQYRLKERMRK